MLLPIRTTVDDIQHVCGYLVTKPTGATLVEAKTVVDNKFLDGRKLTALKFWGLIENADSKIKITERGRQSVKDSGASRSKVLQDVLREIAPYRAVVERVVHRQEESLTATEVASHWYDHFKNDVANTNKILNDQAICFFQIAQGADLGKLTIGRRGLPTRFDFDADAARTFVGALNVDEAEDIGAYNADEYVEPSHDDGTSSEQIRESIPSVRGNRVFITHGKNLNILDHVKRIVTFGKFEPVVAMEHESLAKPVPKKVMDEMKTCYAAVIHVSADRSVSDEDGNEVQLINQNVLIEIGAAMALYGDRFILLVEEGVTLPSNLQGLYECRYQGSELDGPATMKLLEAFNEFGSQ